MNCKLMEFLIKSFDKLRTNGRELIPFVVSLSNHDRNQLDQRLLVGLALLTFSQFSFAAAKIEHWQTSQGSRVYYVQADALPMVDIQVVFDAGSARDGQQFGLAALTSALLDTGAGQWNADQIALNFESVGANFGTGVSSDNASLSLRTLTEPALFDKALETMHVILTKPKFNNADFLREKNRTLAGIKQREESPAEVASEVFSNKLYGAHPYAHPDSGSKETVSKLKASDLSQFYKKYYVSSNAMVVIVGNLTKEQAQQTAEKLLVDLPPGQKPEAIPDVAMPTQASQQHIEFPSTQTPRRQDNAKTEANLRWLLTESNAHLHTDLIFGLPGETLQSFAEGFDRLLDIGPQEIQLGILKRLRGTPLARHTEAHGMVYDQQPPYVIRQNNDIDRESFERFTRLAKYWDLIANSGRFKQTLPLILQAHAPHHSPFWAFMSFTDHLWQQTQKTYGLTPEALVDAVFAYLTVSRLLDESLVRKSLLKDYLASGARGRPMCLAHENLPLGGDRLGSGQHTLRERQDRHADLQK